MSNFSAREYSEHIQNLTDSEWFLLEFYLLLFVFSIFTLSDPEYISKSTILRFLLSQKPEMTIIERKKERKKKEKERKEGKNG